MNIDNLPVASTLNGSEVFPIVQDDETKQVEISKIAEGIGLAEVATSGSYNDLTDKPTIPEQMQSDWNEEDNTKADYIKNKPNLATVATSGNYDDLSNKPTIPAPQVNSDWNADSGVSQILNKPNLATVATSGNYNDLNNKPSVAVIDDTQASASKVYSSNKVTSLVGGVQNEVDLVESLTITSEQETVTDDISDDLTYTTGFMAKNGQVYTGSSYDNYKYSNKIAVNEGDVVFGTSFRIVTAFDSNEQVVTDKGAENTQSATGYTVPSGISYVVITFSISSSVVKRTYQTTTYKNIMSDRVEALENENNSALWFLNTKQRYKSVSRSTMNDGNSLTLISYICDGLAKGERIVFNGNLSTFNKLYIGLILDYTNVSDATKRFNTFEIDNTNVSYKKVSTDEAVVVAHGLTLADNIQIILETSENGKIKFTLISSGVMFTHTFDFSRYTYSTPFVYSVGSSLTDCTLNFTCNDFEKKIWIFGDSYCSYNNARWYYYLQEYGYAQNILLNAFAGCGGQYAKSSFNYLLNFGSPKYCIWSIGMNDGSDSSSAPSANWVSGRNSFLTYCNDNKIIPIFCTIPTVPNVNNEQKNAWVRSSGYRYIDFVKAVGANSSGAWYSGMLSVDNVHPTDKGAKALFARALLDFPELMIGGYDTPTELNS